MLDELHVGGPASAPSGMLDPDDRGLWGPGAARDINVAESSECPLDVSEALLELLRRQAVRHD